MKVEEVPIPQAPLRLLYPAYGALNEVTKMTRVLKSSVAQHVKCCKFFNLDNRTVRPVAFIETWLDIIIS